MLKKTCLILTDGKIGSLNQCIGLADNLVESYEAKSISLRNPWNILNPYIRIDSINPSTEEIKPPYPEIVIVSGRKAVSVALHIKKKSPKTYLIGVLDPRVARNKFDFITFPEHDSYRGKNVITTVGAMHKLTQEKIEAEGEKLKHLFKNLKQKKTIAVLIGGNTKAYKMTPELTKKICNNIKEAAEKLSANTVLTASRRTPVECFDIIQDEFKNTDNVYIWNGEGENPFFAFMNISDYIFVSNDSISMLSEAIFTGKPTYLIELNGKSKKFEKFHNMLKEKSIIKILGKDELIKYSYERIENAKQVARKIEEKINQNK